ncbi:MAG: peptide chain release factor N(5)-glutamine methyltransferase [Puniceicoccales bacterium]|jgi:release factor glutamine methyltransferase|nr:peptide chain release factor N(5)-glutamine methyltransferase [Puniceicoccales bacterium]
MQTLLEILKKTEGFFAGKKLENPRLQAELLLAAALHCKRLELYLQFERLMSEETLARLRDWVRRRAAREPFQYITGETDFRSLTLKCDPRALIPRPETEELAGLVLDALPASGPVRAADLGTGTGAIALSLASERPEMQVVATDRSEKALALARENAQKLGLEARITFVTGNWMHGIEGGFDAIVSNPPYLTEEELATAAPEVAQHEPREALVAQDDGLSDLKTILAQAKAHLLPGGFVALETGIAHADALAAHAESLGYAHHESRKDMSGRDRFFLARIERSDP